VSSPGEGGASAPAPATGAPAHDEPLEADEPFDARERQLLLDVAVEAIRADLEHRPPQPPVDVPPALREPGASFVTLRDGPRLLGCIGTILPIRPLIEDVADNARGAAFRDPRMPALTEAEFARMSVHVSVLTPLEPLEPLGVDSLAALRAVVRPGVDGLLIEAGMRRGTFLPSVWEQLPDTDAFLEHLWRKAGLRPGTWSRGMRVSRYRSIEWGDDHTRAPIEHAPI
jgi:AmmeMemoRadiSam system protein A